jgi:hypothetical protein
MSDEPNFTSQELRDLGLPTYADLRKIADEFHWLADQRGDLLAKRENELDEARAKVAELRAELAELKSVPVLETPHEREVLQKCLETVRVGLSHVVYRPHAISSRELGLCVKCYLLSLLEPFDLGASVEPVPAPRLEWVPSAKNRFKAAQSAWGVSDFEMDGVWALSHNSHILRSGLSLDAAKALAEKLNAVLSPPVGPTPDDVKMEEAMDDFARNTTPGGTWIFEDESGEPE